MEAESGTLDNGLYPTAGEEGGEGREELGASQSLNLMAPFIPTQPHTGRPSLDPLTTEAAAAAELRSLLQRDGDAGGADGGDVVPGGGVRPAALAAPVAAESSGTEPSGEGLPPSVALLGDGVLTDYSAGASLAPAPHPADSMSPSLVSQPPFSLRMEATPTPTPADDYRCFELSGEDNRAGSGAVTLAPSTNDNPYSLVTLASTPSEAPADTGPMVIGASPQVDPQTSAPTKTDGDPFVSSVSSQVLEASQPDMFPGGESKEVTAASLLPRESCDATAQAPAQAPAATVLPAIVEQTYSSDATTRRGAEENTSTAASAATGWEPGPSAAAQPPSAVAPAVPKMQLQLPPSHGAGKPSPVLTAPRAKPRTNLAKRARALAGRRALEGLSPKSDAASPVQGTAEALAPNKAAHLEPELSDAPFTGHRAVGSPGESATPQPTGEGEHSSEHPRSSGASAASGRTDSCSPSHGGELPSPPTPRGCLGAMVKTRSPSPEPPCDSSDHRSISSDSAPVPLTRLFHQDVPASTRVSAALQEVDDPEPSLSDGGDRMVRRSSSSSASRQWSLPAIVEPPESQAQSLDASHALSQPDIFRLQMSQFSQSQQTQQPELGADGKPAARPTLVPAPAPAAEPSREQAALRERIRGAQRAAKQFDERFSSERERTQSSGSSKADQGPAAATPSPSPAPENPPATVAVTTTYMGTQREDDLEFTEEQQVGKPGAAQPATAAAQPPVNRRKRKRPTQQDTCESDSEQVELSPLAARPQPEAGADSQPAVRRSPRKPEWKTAPQPAKKLGPRAIIASEATGKTATRKTQPAPVVVSAAVNEPQVPAKGQPPNAPAARDSPRQAAAGAAFEPDSQDLTPTDSGTWAAHLSKPRSRRRHPIQTTAAKTTPPKAPEPEETATTPSHAADKPSTPQREESEHTPPVTTATRSTRKRRLAKPLAKRPSPAATRRSPRKDKPLKLGLFSPRATKAPQATNGAAAAGKASPGKDEEEELPSTQDSVIGMRRLADTPRAERRRRSSGLGDDDEGDAADAPAPAPAASTTSEPAVTELTGRSGERRDSGPAVEPAVEPAGEPAGEPDSVVGTLKRRRTSGGAAASMDTGPELARAPSSGKGKGKQRQENRTHEEEQQQVGAAAVGLQAGAQTSETRWTRTVEETVTEVEVCTTTVVETFRSGEEKTSKTREETKRHTTKNTTRTLMPAGFDPSSVDGAVVSRTERQRKRRRVGGSKKKSKQKKRARASGLLPEAETGDGDGGGDGTGAASAGEHAAASLPQGEDEAAAEQPAACVRFLEASGPHSLKEGDQVFAFYPADGFYYPGTIRKILKAAFRVKFEDGEIGKSERAVVEQLPVGLSVSFKRGDGEDYWEATVAAAGADGTYTVRDLEAEQDVAGVARGRIILRPGGSVPFVAAAAAAAAAAPPATTEPGPAKARKRRRSSVVSPVREEGAVAATPPTAATPPRATSPANKGSARKRARVSSPAPEHACFTAPASVRPGDPTEFLLQGFVFCITGDVGHKEGIVAQIQARGGVFCETLDKDTLGTVGRLRTVLLCEQAKRTTKYLQAVAANAPCVRTDWLAAVLQAGALVPFGAYLLPADVKMGLPQLLLDASDTPIPGLFDGLALAVEGDTGFQAHARGVLDFTGARVWSKRDEDFPDFTIFQHDSGAESRRRWDDAQERGLPASSLQTYDWLVRCICTRTVVTAAADGASP